MTMPIQFAGEFPCWHEQGLVVGLSENISMVVLALQKEATSSKDMLKAIGVSDEVADQMLELGNEIHGKLTGISRSEMPDEDESSIPDV